MCFTASTRRSHHEHRAAVVGSSPREIADALDALVSGEPRRGSSIGQLRPGGNASAVYVFCGQGPQWLGMGRELLREEPVFKEAVARCDEEIRALAGWSPLDELAAEENRSRLDQTEFAQPVLFTLQVGLAALWASWGVTPSAVVGHSVGEVAAAYVAGALTLADAIRIVVHRGRIMQQATGRGKMAVVELPVREIERAVAAFDGRISIAAVNAPSSTVVSGEPSAIDELVRSLSEQQVLVRPIPVNYAFHSYQMEPCVRELTAALAGLSPGALRVPMFSTVTGRACSGPDLDAAYWGRNVGQRVRFADAIGGLAAGDPRAFLEIGPHPVLTSVISQCLGERTASQHPPFAPTQQPGADVDAVGPWRSVRGRLSGRLEPAVQRVGPLCAAAGLSMAARAILDSERSWTVAWRAAVWTRFAEQASTELLSRGHRAAPEGLVLHD